VDQVTLTEHVKPGMLTRLHGGQGGIVMTAGTGGLLEIRRHKGGGTMKPLRESEIRQRKMLSERLANRKSSLPSADSDLMAANDITSYGRIREQESFDQDRQPAREREKKLTQREYMIQHVAYEKGMIKAWQHIRIICNSCIRAHREELTKQRTRQLVEMNSYRCRKEKP